MRKLICLAAAVAMTSPFGPSAFAQATIDSVRKELQELSAKTRDLTNKEPASVSERVVQPPRDYETPAYNADVQKELALERLQRNLEDQRRQRLDDVLIIEGTR